MQPRHQLLPLLFQIHFCIIQLSQCPTNKLENIHILVKTLAIAVINNDNVSWCKYDRTALLRR